MVPVHMEDVAGPVKVSIFFLNVYLQNLWIKLRSMVDLNLCGVTAWVLCTGEL